MRPGRGVLSARGLASGLLRAVRAIPAVMNDLRELGSQSLAAQFLPPA